MNLLPIPRFAERKKADLLVVPYWEGPIPSFEERFTVREVDLALRSGDFRGKGGETLFVYPDWGHESRILLLGLGKEGMVNGEGLRRAWASAVKVALSKRIQSVNFLTPRLAQREEMCEAILEGALLANYQYLHLKGKMESAEEPPSLLQTMGWIGWGDREHALLETLPKKISSVYFARDLVNGNADEITPKRLAEEALSLQTHSPHVKTMVYDADWLRENRMGLILAVNRGSNNDPFLIQTSYRGNPSSSHHVVLVGKGVTYDTGGLTLKPLEGMLGMKADMAGAATVLAVVRAVALLGWKVNVTALVPAVENSIDAKSYKVGDVYRSYSGRMVEIGNADAEGRLILADALSYAVSVLKPTLLIDVATLTGNVIVALGDEYAGLFSAHEELVQGMMSASQRTGELCWRLPLHAEYREFLKSEIGDIANVGGSREAGAIKGALFLQEFVGSSVPWVHLDVAGVAFWAKPKYYHPTKGTGFGVRLLLHFLYTERDAKIGL